MAGQNPGPAHHLGRCGDCLGRVGSGPVVRIRVGCRGSGVRRVAAGSRRDVRSPSADLAAEMGPSGSTALRCLPVMCVLIIRTSPRSPTAAALNRPAGETLFSLLGRGGYLRIEVCQTLRALPGARWTNYVWRLRGAILTATPSHLLPLPRTRRPPVLTFHTSPATADVALQLFAVLSLAEPRSTGTSGQRLGSALRARADAPQSSACLDPWNERIAGWSGDPTTRILLLRSSHSGWFPRTVETRALGSDKRRNRANGPRGEGSQLAVRSLPGSWC